MADGGSRYFVLSSVRSLDDEPIPEGALVGSRRGLDYIAHTHEMNAKCDCRFCTTHYATEGIAHGCKR